MPSAKSLKTQKEENFLKLAACGSKLLLKERYCAIRLIGQGNFDRIFLALDENKSPKSPCVIKQFLPQGLGTNNAQKAAELFEQEAANLKKLGKHPQIPELYADFGQDGRQYLVQEFIEGQNLDRALETEGVFKETQIRDLLNSLLPVLEFVHAHNIIHRDIKPENIIRRSDGQLILVDFGAPPLPIVMPVARSGRVIGDFRYMAPEQAALKAEKASDLYSLGVSCIHLLTKIHPFDLYSFTEDGWVWRDYLKQAVGERLGSILDKLIEKATQRRYQSAAEVLKELNPVESAFKPAPQLPPPPAPPPTTPTPSTAPVVVSSSSNPESPTWKCVYTLSHTNWVFATALSADGQTLASCSSDKTIKIWHLKTGKLLHTITGHTKWVRCLAFSPDSKILVSGSDDSSIKIWQVATGKLIHTLRVHSSPVYSIAFSPDGETIVSGGYDHTIKISHLGMGQLLHVFKGHSHIVYSIAIEPTGQILASGSYDNTIKL